MAKSRQAYPTDLNDTEWCLIAQLLPTTEEDGPPSRAFVSRNLECHLLHCAQWLCLALLPHDFPSWKTVYTYFRRWRKDGTWERLNTALREAVREKQERHPQPSAAILDSQSVKTVEGGDQPRLRCGQESHGAQASCGGGYAGPGAAGPGHRGECSRPGRSQLVLQALFDRIKKSKFSRWCRLKLIWADGGYRGELMDWVKHTLGWTLEIVEKLGGQRRLPGVAQTLDCRAHLRLAESLPSLEQGL